MVDNKNASDDLVDLISEVDEPSTIRLLLKSIVSPLITQDDIADRSTLRKVSFWDHLTGMTTKLLINLKRSKINGYHCWLTF